jgi:hypothetical protein
MVKLPFMATPGGSQATNKGTINVSEGSKLVFMDGFLQPTASPRSAAIRSSTV